MIDDTPFTRDGAVARPCVDAAWSRNKDDLRRYLRHRLGDAHACDDVLQDVFVKAIGQGRKFCGLDDPRAWLFRVARNSVIDRARTARPAEPLDEFDLPYKESPPEPLDALGACVDVALHELPEADADILRACDLGAMTQRAYAEARGISLAAAKARLLRARTRLREHITVACRVHFDPDSGRVCGHEGRAGAPPASEA